MVLLQLNFLHCPKNFDSFPDHPPLVDPTVDRLFGNTLANMTGHKWHEARSLLTAAFTSAKMKSMFEMMVECAEEFVDYVSQLAKDPDHEVESKDLFAKYTCNVIALCAYGLKLDAIKDPNNEFFMMGRQAASFDNLSLRIFFCRAFPAIAKLFRVQVVPDHARQFFHDVVKKTIETRDKEGIVRPDMIQLMMEARGKSFEHLKLDIAEMSSQVFIFLFGGFDTTSTQMSAIAHELALHPKVQKRLQDEIDVVMAKSNGKPSYEAIDNMPYLDAVFFESVRKYPQANVLDRSCKKPYQLPPAMPGYQPFTVQPHMSVWIPVMGIHYDEKYHPDPDEFKPERYLGKKVSISQVENSGFGLGQRSCIGRRFAVMNTKIMFYYLLSRFTLKPTSRSGSRFELDEKLYTITPKGGYWLTFEPRTSVKV